jgi:selenocysteine lyase/cysteine desulfurase
VVLRLDLTYGAVKKMLTHYFGPRGAIVRELVAPLPIQAEQIVAMVVAALEDSGACSATEPAHSSSSASSSIRACAHGRVRVAVFDHVTSNSAVVLPVAQLQRVCRQRGVLCVIDGAHALGGLDLRLHDIQPDFYVANAHKWLCNPKVCDVVWQLCA